MGSGQAGGFGKEVEKALGGSGVFGRWKVRKLNLGVPTSELYLVFG